MNMKLKTVSVILVIFAAVFAVAGLVLLFFSIFKGADTLIPALSCVALGNVFNLIRLRVNKITAPQHTAGSGSD